jgi:hypothetical protein
MTEKTSAVFKGCFRFSILRKTQWQYICTTIFATFVENSWESLRLKRFDIPQGILESFSLLHFASNVSLYIACYI